LRPSSPASAPGRKRRISIYKPSENSLADSDGQGSAADKPKKIQFMGCSGA
jgi:hypothetical protein